MFGVKRAIEPDRGLPVLKPWRIMTDCNELIHALHVTFCDHSHEHARINGDTKQTGHYPVMLANAIHRAFHEAVRNKMGNACNHTVVAY